MCSHLHQLPPHEFCGNHGQAGPDGDGRARSRGPRPRVSAIVTTLKVLNKRDASTWVWRLGSVRSTDQSRSDGWSWVRPRLAQSCDEPQLVMPTTTRDAPVREDPAHGSRVDRRDQGHRAPSLKARNERVLGEFFRDVASSCEHEHETNHRCVLHAIEAFEGVRAPPPESFQCNADASDTATLTSRPPLVHDNQEPQRPVRAACPSEKQRDCLRRPGDAPSNFPKLVGSRSAAVGCRWDVEPTVICTTDRSRHPTAGSLCD